MLDDAKARLTTLDAQIMLTQRTIKAQEYNAQSVAAAVERARALVKQTTSTRIRLEPLVPQGLPRRKISIRRAPPRKRPGGAGGHAAAGQTGLGGRDRRGCHGGATRRDPGANRPRRTASGIHRVRAPFNGVVVALKTTVGQYASALKPVFTLLDDDRWYVIANFRETDLNNVRPGWRRGSP